MSDPLEPMPETGYLGYAKPGMATSEARKVEQTVVLAKAFKSGREQGFVSKQHHAFLGYFLEHEKYTANALRYGPPDVATLAAIIRKIDGDNPQDRRRSFTGRR